MAERSWGSMPAPGESTPFQLYRQAELEHPGDPEARRARYRELMREAGFIVARCEFRDGERRCELAVHEGDNHSFDPPTLPCGWPLR